MLWNENGRHLLDSLHSSLVIYAHTVKIKIKDQRSRLEENCKNRKPGRAQVLIAMQMGIGGYYKYSMRN